VKDSSFIGDTKVNRFFDEIRVDSVEYINELNRQHGWDVEFRQMERGLFRGAVDLRCFETNALAKELYNHRVDVLSAPPSGMVAVAIGTNSGREMKLNSMEFSDDYLLLIWPGTETYLSMPEMGSMFVTHFDVSKLQESLELRHPALCKKIPQQGAGLYTCRRDYLESLRLYITYTLYGPQRSTALERETFSMLQSLILDTLATAFEKVNTDQFITGSRTAIALKAREYIDAHHHRRISLNELHREVHAGDRTLERAFLQTFDLSIRSYIKLCRLNTAHRALVMSDREYVSVTDVAWDSGFTHLGRFAVEYKKLFGESPSKSLRQ
jgi:AraC family ethanolamine operon transcriptional activator